MGSVLADSQRCGERQNASLPLWSGGGHLPVMGDVSDLGFGFDSGWSVRYADGDQAPVQAAIDLEVGVGGEEERSG